MKHFQPINRRLMPTEWSALRAALPCCNRSVPLVRGLLGSLPINAERTEIFTLRGACTDKPHETFFVLLGWQEPPDDPPESLWLFAIYGNESYTGALPTFDELYRQGLGVMRAQAKSDALGNCFFGLVIGFVLWFIVGLCGLAMGLGRSYDGDTRLWAIVNVALGMGILAGFTTWITSRSRRLKRIPKESIA